MKIVISLILKSIILFYQRIISPLLPPTCRYQTTCSNYALKAINKYGPFKGSVLALKRILTCHPWGGHGDDSLI